MSSYTSLDEAFGGISGNHFLNVPLYKQRHPVHQKRIDEAEQAKQQKRVGVPAEQQLLPWKTANDPVQCQIYDGSSCAQALNRNQAYQNAAQFITDTPYLRPQYPWYPAMQMGYLGYGPMVSSAFYNAPWMYYPQLAQEMSQNPNYQPMPMGTYRGDNFTPGLYYNPAFVPPGAAARSPGTGGATKSVPPNTKITEHFRQKYQVTPMQLMVVFFMFFLILLAIIMCLFFLAIFQRRG